MRPRLAIAFAFALSLLTSAAGRADCDSMLGDALGACPCLACPLFLVPAVCCAGVLDDPDAVDCLTGGCLCYRFIGVDGPLLMTQQELPPSPSHVGGMAY